MDTKHSFLKGMNRDLSKDKFPTDAYYYLLNGRILTDDDATMSDIINLKSNMTADIDDTSPNGILDRTGFVIIGYTTINNDIVLFYAEDNSTTDDYTTYGIIDLLEYRGNNQYKRLEKWNGIGLNFRSDKKIRAVGNVENENVVKIYWSDNNEELRHANIKDFIYSYVPEQFSIIGRFENNFEPEFVEYSNGNLKQGAYFYAYRLIKQHNNKTIFSAISNPIYSGKKVITTGVNGVKGDDIYNPESPYDTGIGIKIKIDLNAALIAEYDWIEVVSLWLSNDDGIPDINIIAKQSISVGDNYFVDSGTVSYGTLTLPEFLYESFEFTCKDLAIKDSRLFTANITENYFDLDEALGSYWDSRAYRFNSARHAYLYAADFSTIEYNINGSSPNYAQVSPVADCVNKFNKITLNTADHLDASGRIAKYKANGTTVGGEGLNVEYIFSFGYEDLITYTSNNPDITGSTNEYNRGIIKGLQHDEVYRVGVVFFDTSGRQSFTKWIGDIRTNRGNTSNTLASSPIPTSGNVKQYPLNLIVYLKNPPILDGEHLNWQIVYVKREHKDKSIIYAGILNPTRYEHSYNGSSNTFTRCTHLTASGTYYSASDTPSADNINKYLWNFYSPDLMFDKQTIKEFDYIDISGDMRLYNYISRDAANDHLTYNTTNYNPIANIHDAIVIGRLNSTILSEFGEKIDIVESKFFPQGTGNFGESVGVDVFSNKLIAYYSGDYQKAYGASTIAMRLGAKMTRYNNNNYIYAYARNIVYDSQYGGASYEARRLNIYIPLSEVRDKNTPSVATSKGDTNITAFEVVRMTWHEDERSFFENIHFAVESKFNNLYRHDEPFSTIWRINKDDPHKINENVYTNSTTGLTFEKLYGYNQGYNSINNIKKFFSKPDFYENISHYQTLIKYSSVKINNEDYDNFLNFRANDNYEENGNYGEINRIVDFNDKLYTFQDRAVAILSINPRVTQQSNDGVSIVLGSGDVIDSTNYITTDIGCQDNSDIIKSFSAMYWLDKNKKKIYSFDGKLQSVTDLKGMHSYLKNNVREESYFIGTYDVANAEVVMTLYDDSPDSEFIMTDYAFGNKRLTGNADKLDYNFVVGNTYKFNDAWYIYEGRNEWGIYLNFSHGVEIPDGTYVDLHHYMTERDNFTLAYSEKIQAFTSFYSFVPNLYIYHNRDYFTSNNSLDLWQHNIGTNYNQFYNISYPLQLKLISDYGSQAQGDFTNLKYFMTVKDTEGAYLRNETFTNIHCKNEYQNTTDIILYPMHLNNAEDRTRYVLDTSSIRIGRDWYTGLNTPNEGLVVYENELYRNISGGNVTTSPELISGNWAIAELANIRKTVEHWFTQMPRYERYTNDEEVYDHDNLTSDRMKSDWLETTLEFRSVLPNVNIEERALKISDITLINYPSLL